MLTDICKRNGWEIVRTFENKVSGAKKNEERQEIVDLIDYVKNNEVDMVVATEVSRLGRDTLEALKIIEILNEYKVNLYFANYGLETLLPDKTPSPIANLVLGIMSQFNSLEKTLIRARMSIGYEHHRASGGRVGRKEGYRKSEDEYRLTYDREIALLSKGNTLKDVRAITGTSINTLRKLKANYC
jgi:DNA invertase Pin-like site-specific DNA recombinase